MGLILLGLGFWLGLGVFFSFSEYVSGRSQRLMSINPPKPELHIFHTLNIIVHLEVLLISMSVAVAAGANDNEMQPKKSKQG